MLLLNIEDLRLNIVSILIAIGTKLNISFKEINVEHNKNVESSFGKEKYQSSNFEIILNI